MNLIRSLPRNWRIGVALSVFVLAPSAHSEIVISEKPPEKGISEGLGIDVPAPGSDTTPSVYDVLKLLNGDVLHGTFFSADAQTGLRWRHPAIQQVLEVDLASVASVFLKRPTAEVSHSNETCLVKLTNQDELVGRLASLDTNFITLDTWYAGLVTIPRNMAKLIAPGQAPSTAVFEGPTTMEGWTLKSNKSGQRGGMAGINTWKYNRGAFFGVGNSSIGRDVKLPPRSNIEFDLAWRGYLQLGVSFYADKLERYGGDCYMLQLNTGSIYLQRMASDGNSSNFGHSEAAALSQKSKVHISLRSNKDLKTFTLLIDGAMVKQWTERGEFSTGTGLVFFQQGQGMVKLDKLRITEWDGKFEEPSGAEEGAQEDLIRLANNDKISGILQEIQGGKIRFGTEFATLEIPLQRVAEISLAGASATIADRRPGDVRATFGDRGILTLQLERWDDQQVVAHSPNFGKIKFQPPAFSRIDFNLDQHPETEDLLDFDDDSAQWIQFQEQ